MNHETVYKGLLLLVFILTVLGVNVGQPCNGAPKAVRDRTVTITVDDLPGAVPGSDRALGNLSDFERYNRLIVQILNKHKVPAIGFVNEIKLQVPGERDARAALLERWLSGGLELGNHTYSHANFDETSLQEFEVETLHGEVVTRALLSASGKSERYFRHPALSTGATQEAKAAFETFLASHGYRIAPVTVENADYQFNDTLADAVAIHNEQDVERAKADYLAYTTGVFQYVESQSTKLFGHEIPQVLLIHDNEINAEVLDALLTQLEERNYRFVSLDSALADPAYGSREAFVGNLDACYLCWNSRLAAVGQKLEYEGAPIQPSDWTPIRPPGWVTTKFEEIRRRNAR